MIMSDSSYLSVLEYQKDEIIMFNGVVFNIKYPKTVADNYRYMGEVDNHNTFRNDGGNKSQIGLDGAWGTTWCPIWFFSFFLACTKVN